MADKKYITLHCRRRDHNVETDKILYVLMKRSYAEVHIYGGEVYVTRRTYKEFVEILGDDFIEIKRGCIVSAMAIQNVTKQGVELINGECVNLTARRKKEVKAKMHEEKQRIFANFAEGSLRTAEDYHRHYAVFDNMPFAFTDIELIYNEKSQAVDWVFRYGNEALARLEMIPLENIIGNTFGSLFQNMDKKWLLSYERSAIYGETLEILDYSPEIDRHLKIISFPTFKGHCGCIMFDLNDMEFTASDETLAVFKKMLDNKQSVLNN